MTKTPVALSPVTLYGRSMGDLRVGDIVLLNVGRAEVKEINEVGHDLKITTEIAGFLDVATYPRWVDVGAAIERAM